MKIAILALAATILLAPMAHSDTTFGRWSTGVTGDKSGVYASTVNDEGSVFGEYCYFSTKICSWNIAIDMVCEKDAYYPVLANSDKGAASLMLQCVGPMTGNSLYYQYVFNNWKDVEKLIKTGSKLGIATPLQSDQFKVYRFLLDGMTQSTASVETPFWAAVAANGGKSSTTKPTNTTKSEIL
jgi:hypothetical protein